MHRLAAQFPDQDFTVDHFYLGSGKGGAWRITHVPTGISLMRTVGFEPVARFRPEMIAELFGGLRSANLPLES